jgi:hypothetical protein
MTARIKKPIFVLFSVIFFATLLVNPAKAAAFEDVKADFWAAAAIDRWSNYQVVKGSGGAFNPDSQITRAELLAILVRIFGYTDTAGENPFSDMKKTDWYYQDLLKAYQKGILTGSAGADGKLSARPADPITRAEAAVLFNRAFALSGQPDWKTGFKDQLLPDWARQAIYTMESGGYIRGQGDSMFNPGGSLSRAEAVQMADNVIKVFICSPGTYSADVAGNVVINTPGVVLRNMTITGNLYLADGIGENDVTLDHVVVTGTAYVSGGGQDKIKISDCELGALKIQKQGLTLPEADATDNTSGGSGGESGGGSGGSVGDY